MRVRDAMSTTILSIGPDHTLRDAARMMSARRVGAAAVVDPDTSGIGILTERDILNAIGAGQDPDVERASAHLTSDLVFATPDWSLDQAAEEPEVSRAVSRRGCEGKRRCIAAEISAAGEADRVEVVVIVQSGRSGASVDRMNVRIRGVVPCIEG